MEFRKLVAFGKSSFIITLPKGWINRNKLKKGDTLTIDDKETDLIVSINGSTKCEDKLREITIDIEDYPIERIQTELISAYINNYSTINIIGKSLQKNSAAIRKILHNLIALEILEETSGRIVAKDFLNMNEISIVNLIKKMDTITKSMLEDSKKVGNENQSTNIYRIDYDVNRLSFLVQRAVRCALQDSSIAKKNGMTQLDLMNSLTLASLIEMVADQAKRAARGMKKINLDKNTMNKLLQIYDISEKSYSEVMRAYYTKNERLAYSLLQRRGQVVKQAEELLNKNRNNLTLADVLEKIKAMASFSHNIGKLVYG